MSKRKMATIVLCLLGILVIRHQACSECHITYCIPDGQDGVLDMTFYNFCPNCGADMRGEEND